MNSFSTIFKCSTVFCFLFNLSKAEEIKQKSQDEFTYGTTIVPILGHSPSKYEGFVLNIEKPKVDVLRSDLIYKKEIEIYKVRESTNMILYVSDEVALIVHHLKFPKKFKVLDIEELNKGKGDLGKVMIRLSNNDKPSEQYRLYFNIESQAIIYFDEIDKPQP